MRSDRQSTAEPAFGDTACGPDVGGSGQGTWSADRATCWGWTRNTNEGCPRMGRSWCMSASCTPAGGGSGTNWMSALREGGCAPGINLMESGGPKPGEYTVGTGGGYGGIYCFALVP